ncbi:MAG: hypothetical protein SFU99_09795 [Saprospiraceae bacterium]|nr:hypothetical protein [Saprospiraceae bacterium]
MDKLQLLDRALQLFSGFKNKAFTAIGKEINDAFSNEVMIQYDRFKHWFVKEDPTAAKIWEKYEAKPDANEATVKSIAEDKLNEDSAFAETLQKDLDTLEAKYFDVINRIGKVEGENNDIQQGTGNAGDGSKTLNEIEQVKGSGNKIVQGSYNYNPPKKD